MKPIQINARMNMIIANIKVMLSSSNVVEVVDEEVVGVGGADSYPSGVPELYNVSISDKTSGVSKKLISSMRPSHVYPEFA